MAPVLLKWVRRQGRGSDGYYTRSSRRSWTTQRKILVNTSRVVLKNYQSSLRRNCRSLVKQARIGEWRKKKLKFKSCEGNTMCRESLPKQYKEEGCISLASVHRRCAWCRRRRRSAEDVRTVDRKRTRLNSSHMSTSY